MSKRERKLKSVFRPGELRTYSYGRHVLLPSVTFVVITKGYSLNQAGIVRGIDVESVIVWEQK